MTSPTAYNWTRYWYPLEATSPADEGYLAPYEDDGGKTLPELSDVPCLVLLGAPGMGKSFEAAALAAHLHATNQIVDFISAPRRRDLHQSLIELFTTEHAVAWRNKQTVWTLVIDGIDELPGGAASFASILRDFLETLVHYGGNLSQFHLRLFCRTADWADACDQALSVAFDNSQVQKRQLAPLQEVNVLEAANRDLGGSTEARAFVSAIAETNLEPLSARPVSYRMLVGLFERSSSIPLRQSELYQRGLGLLAEDPGSLARPGRITLDPDAVVIVAARIAFAMAHSGRYSIATDISHEGTLTVDDVLGGTEPLPPHRIQLSRTDILDVLRTPLFQGLGSGIYVFAHRTFLEYLAAFYLIAHELDAASILDLLTVQDPDGTTGGVPIQLREVAAWTATLSPAVFNALLATEPDILLRSDVAAVDEATRFKLVAAILLRLENHDFARSTWQLRHLFDRLRHSHLAEQLRGVICDPGAHLFVRRGAIDIAEENNQAELASDLVQIALDRSEPEILRQESASAVRKLGDDNHKRMLATILEREDVVGLSDELRGQLLLATWPEFLPFPALLKALTPRKQRNFVGAYARFLNRFEPGRLLPGDAALAAQWIKGIVASLTEHAETDFTMREAVSRLFWATLSQASSALARSTLIDTLNTVLDCYADWIFDPDAMPTGLSTDPQDRVEFVLEFLRQASDPIKAGRRIQHSAPLLLPSEDLGIYSAKVLELQPEGLKAAAAELLVSLTRNEPLESLGEVWALAQSDLDVGKAWEAVWSVELDSHAARWMRDSHERHLKDELRTQSKGEQRKQVNAAMADVLQKVKSKPEIWWQANLQLFVTDDGSFDPNFEFLSDLTIAPGWKRLSQEDKEVFIEGAKAYLAKFQFDNLDWLGAPTHDRRAAAGYRALRLLKTHRPSDYDSLDTDIWSKWTGAVLGFFDNEATDAFTIQTAILADAYRASPDSLISSLTRLATQETSEGLTQRPIQLLEGLYDEQIGQALAGLLPLPLRGTAGEGLITKFLVRHRFSDILEVTQQDLALRAKSNFPSAATAGFVNATAQLLASGNLAAWRDATRLSDVDEILAKEIWGELANLTNYDTELELDRLDESIIGDAYFALIILFPAAGDDDEESRFFETADFTDRLRKRLVNHLVSRGTKGSVSALETLTARLPDDWWVTSNLPEAVRAFRAKAERLGVQQVLRRIEMLGPNYPARTEIAAAKASVSSASVVTAPVTTFDAVAASVQPALETQAVGQRKLRIVTVATEWRSGHGGLSTLNRELCIALAQQGHVVQCVVLDATPADIDAAGQHGVDLIRCPDEVGISSRERFLLVDAGAFGPASPDIVLGHDQITGPYAHIIAKKLEAAYVHFLHTAPEDIEPYKDHEDVLRGDSKRTAQRSLCERARMVVGIGPQIHGQIPDTGSTPSYMMIPGLNNELLKVTKKPRPGVSCLIGGRMEDANLKGLPIAAKAVQRVNSDYEVGKGDFLYLIVRGLSPDSAAEELSLCGLEVEEVQSFIHGRRFETDTKLIHGDIFESSLVLMPSMAEGFGLTGYEAIAAGIPVLISAASGLAKWLIKLETDGEIPEGFIAACIERTDAGEIKSVEPWCNKIKAILSDRDASFERALQLRAALQVKYTWANAAKEFVDAVVDIIDADR